MSSLTFQSGVMSKKQKYDGWTRKLIKKLRKIGFVMEKATATSHRKYILEGKFKKNITLVIPTHIPEYSRAAVVEYVRKELEQGGADKKTVQAFRNYALGMLDAESSDSIDELEEKLFGALKTNNVMDAVSIAFALGKLVTDEGDERNKPNALLRFKAEKDEKAKQSQLVAQVEKVLFEDFKTAISEQLSRTQGVFVSVRQPFSCAIFDSELVRKFGFDITSMSKDEFGSFVFHGYFKSSVYGSLFDGKSEISFSTRVAAEEEKEDLYIVNPDVFEDLIVEYCYWMAENKYEHFEKQFAWLSLKRTK